MGDQLKQLASHGQSIWLDYIRRNMFSSGSCAASSTSAYAG